MLLLRSSCLEKIPFSIHPPPFVRPVSLLLWDASLLFTLNDRQHRDICTFPQVPDIQTHPLTNASMSQSIHWQPKSQGFLREQCLAPSANIPLHFFPSMTAQEREKNPQNTEPALWPATAPLARVRVEWTLTWETSGDWTCNEVLSQVFRNAGTRVPLMSACLDITIELPRSPSPRKKRWLYLLFFVIARSKSFR